MRGVIGVQAKIVGDLIRNYKSLGTLCLMQRVLSAPLRKSSILSDEPIRNYPSWNEINKLKFEKEEKEKKKRGILDNRESLIGMAFV